jgi:hypothetical protein
LACIWKNYASLARVNALAAQNEKRPRVRPLSGAWHR